MMLSTILVALFKEFNRRLILLQRITNTINELTLRAICIRPSSKETSRNFCKGKYWSRIYRNYNHPEQIPSQDLGRHLVEEKQKHRHSHHDQSIPMKWTNTRGNILVWIWRKFSSDLYSVWYFWAVVIPILLLKLKKKTLYPLQESKLFLQRQSISKTRRLSKLWPKILVNVVIAKHQPKWHSCFSI